jgi:hypothetical protein
MIKERQAYTDPLSVCAQSRPGDFEALAFLFAPVATAKRGLAKRDCPSTTSSQPLEEMRLACVASQVGRHYLRMYGLSSGSLSGLMALSGSSLKACIKSATLGPNM